MSATMSEATRETVLEMLLVTLAVDAQQLAEMADRTAVMRPGIAQRDFITKARQVAASIAALEDLTGVAADGVTA